MQQFEKLKAPFPYFGGKSRVADVVWQRFGAVKNYVEPFCGSAAMLLARPDWQGTIETVNDADGFIANFWRALAAEPETVARHAYWIVSELDLHARHKWLIEHGCDIVEQLRDDPDFYDVKIAGWWVWGISCWIGDGWCQSESRQIPHLGNAGKGVNGLSLGRGAFGAQKYFHLLAKRLERVRVCCGDWSRITGYTPTTKQGLTAVFLDPPYSQKHAWTDGAYRHKEDVFDDVAAWAVERGDDPLFRIALCGYEGTFEPPDGWETYAWQAVGYGAGKGGNGDANRRLERIWFSPHCIKPARTLFD